MALVFQESFFKNWETQSNFSVKSKVLRRGTAPSYTESFLFILSFNVAPYLFIITGTSCAESCFYVKYNPPPV